MPAKSGDSYHHGDLRAACLRAARELLEEEGRQGGGAGLSLRAVARRAGVSPTAPYRHYADREALVAAVSAVGYRELAEKLAEAHPAPSTPADLAEVAVAYVRFSLDHPALFRVMFVEPCDTQSEERNEAVAAIAEYVTANVERAFPGNDPAALTTAVWALVHGLAFLHIDGKLDAVAPEAVADNVRSAVNALFAAAASVTSTAGNSG